MGARGPKSSANLTVVRSEPVTTENRALTPTDFSHDEADEWRRIVDAQPADWLRPGLDVILAGYIRWTIIERRESAIITQIMMAEEFDEGAYIRAVGRLEKASRYLASAAVRLGFAHSTGYEARKPKGKGPRKPWESDEA